VICRGFAKSSRPRCRSLQPKYQTTSTCHIGEVEREREGGGACRTLFSTREVSNKAITQLSSLQEWTGPRSVAYQGRPCTRSSNSGNNNSTKRTWSRCGQRLQHSPTTTRPLTPPPASCTPSCPPTCPPVGAVRLRHRAVVAAASPAWPRSTPCPPPQCPTLTCRSRAAGCA
jgi:hypothetical protein